MENWVSKIMESIDWQESAGWQEETFPSPP